MGNVKCKFEIPSCKQALAEIPNCKQGQGNDDAEGDIPVDTVEDDGFFLQKPTITPRQISADRSIGATPRGQVQWNEQLLLDGQTGGTSGTMERMYSSERTSGTMEQGMYVSEDRRSSARSSGGGTATPNCSPRSIVSPIGSPRPYGQASEESFPKSVSLNMCLCTEAFNSRDHECEGSSSHAWAVNDECDPPLPAAVGIPVADIKHPVASPRGASRRYIVNQQQNLVSPRGASTRWPACGSGSQPTDRRLRHKRDEPRPGKPRWSMSKPFFDRLLEWEDTLQGKESTFDSFKSSSDAEGGWDLVQQEADGLCSRSSTGGIAPYSIEQSIQKSSSDSAFPRPKSLEKQGLDMTRQKSNGGMSSTGGSGSRKIPLDVAEGRSITSRVSKVAYQELFPRRCMGESPSMELQPHGVATTFHGLSPRMESLCSVLHDEAGSARGSSRASPGEAAAEGASPLVSSRAPTGESEALETTQARQSGFVVRWTGDSSIKQSPALSAAGDTAPIREPTDESSGICCDHIDDQDADVVFEIPSTLVPATDAIPEKLAESVMATAVPVDDEGEASHATDDYIEDVRPDATSPDGCNDASSSSTGMPGVASAGDIDEAVTSVAKLDSDVLQGLSDGGTGHALARVASDGGTGHVSSQSSQGTGLSDGGTGHVSDGTSSVLGSATQRDSSVHMLPDVISTNRAAEEAATLEAAAQSQKSDMLPDATSAKEAAEEAATLEAAAQSQKSDMLPDATSAKEAAEEAATLEAAAQSQKSDMLPDATSAKEAAIEAASLEAAAQRLAEAAALEMAQAYEMAGQIDKSDVEGCPIASDKSSGYEVDACVSSQGMHKSESVSCVSKGVDHIDLLKIRDADFDSMKSNAVLPPKDIGATEAHGSLPPAHFYIGDSGTSPRDKMSEKSEILLNAEDGVLLQTRGVCFLSRLLKDKSEGTAHKEAVDSHSQADVNRLKRKLLPLHARTVDFLTPTPGENVHSRFLDMADKRVFEMLARQLLCGTVSVPQTSQPLHSLGLQVALIAGIIELLQENLDVFNTDLTAIPRCCPRVWAINLLEDGWSDHAQAALFNSSELWVQLLPGERPDYVGHSSGELVAVLRARCPVTDFGGGQSRMLHWEVAALDPLTEDIFSEMDGFPLQLCGGSAHVPLKPKMLRAAAVLRLQRWWHRQSVLRTEGFEQMIGDICDLRVAAAEEVQRIWRGNRCRKQYKALLQSLHRRLQNRALLNRRLVHAEQPIQPASPLVPELQGWFRTASRHLMD